MAVRSGSTSSSTTSERSIRRRTRPRPGALIRRAPLSIWPVFHPRNERAPQRINTLCWEQAGSACPARQPAATAGSRASQLLRFGDTVRPSPAPAPAPSPVTAPSGSSHCLPCVCVCALRVLRVSLLFVVCECAVCCFSAVLLLCLLRARTLSAPVQHRGQCAAYPARELPFSWIRVHTRPGAQRGDSAAAAAGLPPRQAFGPGTPSKGKSKTMTAGSTTIEGWGSIHSAVLPICRQSLRCPVDASRSTALAWNQRDEMQVDCTGLHHLFSAVRAPFRVFRIGWHSPPRTRDEER